MIMLIHLIIIFLSIISYNNADEKYMIGLSAHDIGSVTCNSLISTAGYATFFVQAIDLDSDGNIDILLNCQGSGNIYWYKNDGFQRFIEYLIGDVGSDVTHFTMADFNNDGKIDVAGTSFTESAAILFLNYGGNENPNNFTKSTIRTAYADNAMRIIAYDFDNNGDVDVLTGGKSGNEISFWYNNGGSDGGTRTFSIKYVNSLDDIYSISLADFNRDGWMDFVVTEKGNGIFWYRNTQNFNAAANFDRIQIQSDTYFGSDVHSIYASDIDRDDITDILTCDKVTNIIYWVKNGIIIIFYIFKF